MQMGTMPFAMPFYFSDGTSCANFNQLALACDERWEEARELLAAGHWPSFFGGIGRLDLATVAKQAVKEPDRDLALSLLLEKFPADPEALRPPKLTLDSTEINLGQLRPNKDQVFELTVINQGMLVLRGMVTSNADWMVFGDRAGPKHKMIQTRNLCTLRIRALGSKLRAGNKPMVGEIVVDTNGGTITVPVRAEVPIFPFPKGVYTNDSLAGAKSPQEIAVKAKQSPADAAVLFEQGAVRNWYQTNGWIYPVEGRDGSGKGAVQQFFEALGLAKPPKLKIDTEYLMFKGRIGDRRTKTITVYSDEPRPVYAQAWSNQDWVEFGEIKYLGNKVKIPVTVTMPPQPGETVLANVTVQGNGKQKFAVTVGASVAEDDLEVVVEEEEALPDKVRKGFQSFMRGILGDDK